MRKHSLGLGALGLALFLLPVVVAGAGGTSPVADAAMNRDMPGLRDLIAKNTDVKVARTDGSAAAAVAAAAAGELIDRVLTAPVHWRKVIIQV